MNPSPGIDQTICLVKEAATKHVNFNWSNVKIEKPLVSRPQLKGSPNESSIYKIEPSTNPCSTLNALPEIQETIDFAPEASVSPSQALSDSSALPDIPFDSLATCNVLEIPTLTPEISDPVPVLLETSAPVPEFSAPIPVLDFDPVSELSMSALDAPDFDPAPVSLSDPVCETAVSASESRPLSEITPTSALTPPPLEEPQNLPATLRISTMSLENWVDDRKNGEQVFAIFLRALDESTGKPTIPEKYKEFAEVFSKAKSEILPDHQPFDLAIELEEGKSPPFGPIYGLSQEEHKALVDYLHENLEKGFIRHSNSEAASPVLFSRKKDVSLRMVVDYLGLNSITRKDRYPIPLISQLLDQTDGSIILTKIDLRGAYNLLRIREGDEYKQLSARDIAYSNIS